MSKIVFYRWTSIVRTIEGLHTEMQPRPRVVFKMTTAVESTNSEKLPEGSAKPSRWMNFGVIAMTSVVLGGMATAWWYRKTLIRLRQAQDTAPNPEFWISEDDLGDDI